MLFDLKISEEEYSLYLSASLILSSAVLYFLETSVFSDVNYIDLFYVLLSSSVIFVLYDALRNTYSTDKLVRKNIFLWFSTGFITSRLFVRVAGIGSPEDPIGQIIGIPLNQIWLGGYHLHHYLFGLLMIIVSGIISLERIQSSRVLNASLFGLGLGILFDEIGLLISLGDYSSEITYSLTALMTFILFLNAEIDLVRKFLNYLRSLIP